MMFKIETFGNRKVSFSKDELSLTIDIWGDDLFTGQFGAEIEVLYDAYMIRQRGEPVRSRNETHIGIGKNRNYPNTISVGFVCKEDLEDFEKHVRKALKKEGTFTTYKKLQEQEEELRKKERAFLDKQKEEALNPKE